MNRWLPVALALAGCLSSPPSGTGGPPGDGGGPPAARVEVLGAFPRDHFTFDEVDTDDLVAAIA